MYISGTVQLHCLCELMKKENNVKEKTKLNELNEEVPDVNSKQDCCAGCRRAQTLPNGIPPIGKIHPFRKVTITFKPLMGF